MSDEEALAHYRARYEQAAPPPLTDEAVVSIRALRGVSERSQAA